MFKEKDELDEFYIALKTGMTITEFLNRYEAIFQYVQDEDLTKDYRLARGKMKKLRDEVTPVARFVRQCAAPEDQIWFAIDDKTAPDCCVRHVGGRLREIEVTVAQARERLNVMTELNERGTGRGHLGLSDNAPTEEFVRRMEEPRIAHTTEDIARTMICSVAISAHKKRKSPGDTLLIEAPLETLPAERWRNFRPPLAEKVKELAFGEVYVTGRTHGCDVCLRIK